MFNQLARGVLNSFKNAPIAPRYPSNVINRGLT